MMLPMDDLQQLTVGGLLENRRLKLGLSLAEVAAKTNIRRTYLEALEEDRYEALPGEVYQIGFLRNYAEALGLEPGSVLRKWREETSRGNDGQRGEPSVTPTLLSGTTPPRSRPRRWIFLLLPLLLIAASALYFIVNSRSGPEGQLSAPSVSAPAPPLVQNISSPTGESPLSLPENATEAMTVVTEKPTTPAVAAVAALPVIPAEGSVIRLVAMGPLTVEVVVDSRPLQRYVLDSASALQWSVGRSAWLAMDRPEAAKIWLGGEPLELAGRSEIALQAAIPE
jgi:cytoskeleton protein RodZ